MNEVFDGNQISPEFAIALQGLLSQSNALPLTNIGTVSVSSATANIPVAHGLGGNGVFAIPKIISLSVPSGGFSVTIGSTLPNFTYFYITSTGSGTVLVTWTASS